MTIPAFRRASAPKLGSTDGKRDRKREKWRGSRQSRGYDAEWERLRDRYMADSKGLCEECKRRGYLEPAAVVDHIEPVRDSPEKRLDYDNLQALCTPHHAWKFKVEEYARKTGQISLLGQWMREPSTRPPTFQIVKRGPLSELFDGKKEYQARPETSRCRA